MATSGAYSEHLTCSICLSIFNDPVTLICGHSFCRHCIADAVNKLQRCPQCRTAIPAEGTCLQTSHILKGLAEKAREEMTMQTRAHEKAEVTELCPEHKERPKLFCVTDRRLVCAACCQEKEHRWHKFIAIKEAAVLLREKLEDLGQHVADDISATESLANTQMQVMANTVDRAHHLRTQVSRQFKEMHQFLRSRENELKNELQRKEDAALEEMGGALTAMEIASCESKVLAAMVSSVLEITDSEQFIKSATENDSMATLEESLRPRANELQVVHAPLSLGPYESHLQFFMWKEMLQVVQPRAELLSLQTSSEHITISDDRRSLRCSPRSTHPISDYDLIKWLSQPKSPCSSGASRGLGQTSPPPLFGSFGQTTPPPLPSSTNHASSVNEFSSGQYYWEIDVGHRDYWELGINDHFLKYHDQKYSACSQSIVTVLSFTGRPRKIGIYLDCSSMKLSFYNADSMSHVYTLSCSVTSTPLSAHFSIRNRTPDPNPMTVCYY